MASHAHRHSAASSQTVLSTSPDAAHIARPTFQPRIVRANVAAPSSQYSSGGITSARAPRPRRMSSTGGHPASSSVAPGLHSDAPISFVRPAYTEHSIARDYVQVTPYIPVRSTTHSASTSSNTLNNAIEGRNAAIHRRLSLSRRLGLPPGYTVQSAMDDSDDDESVSSAGDAPFRSRTFSALSASASVHPPPRAKSPPSHVFGDAVQLPSRWNPDDKAHGLTLSSDGREVHFVSSKNLDTSDTNQQASAVRANYPMPRACGVYYFETEIVNKGSKGHIGIGFGSKSVALYRLPGWEPQSWGYHGDDGHAFAKQGSGTPYGPKFTTGDIVGCGVDFTLNRAFYTKNGAFQGYIFENLEGELYPIIGLRTLNETVRTNFGHKAFKFDIDAYVHRQRNATWSDIQRTPVGWSTSSHSFVLDDATQHSASSSTIQGDISGPMDRIVLDYLSHHGYGSAAQALQAAIDSRRSTAALPSADTPSASTDFVKIRDDPVLRQRIMTATIAGDIDTALQEIETHYPAALHAHGDWMLFRLRCRKFVEMILEAAEVLKSVRKADEEEEERMRLAKDVEQIEKIRMKDSALGIGTKADELGGCVATGDHSLVAAAPAMSPIPPKVTPTEADDAMEVDDEEVVDDRLVQQVLSRTTPTFSSPPSSPIRHVRVSFSMAPPAAPATVDLKGKQKHSSIPPPQTPKANRPFSSTNTTPPAALEAFNRALTYGRALHAEYSLDARTNVQALFKRTFSLVAYEDPLEYGGEVSRFVGQDAREELAIEVNRGILASQGRHPRAVLERMLRQAGAVSVELALKGHGPAAFADVRELVNERDGF